MANTYSPAAPARDDRRPLAVLLGLGDGCHECGRLATGAVEVEGELVEHCRHHRAIVERVARLQLTSWRVV